MVAINTVIVCESCCNLCSIYLLNKRYALAVAELTYASSAAKLTTRYRSLNNVQHTHARHTHTNSNYDCHACRCARHIGDGDSVHICRICDADCLCLIDPFWAAQTPSVAEKYGKHTHSHTSTQTTNNGVQWSAQWLTTCVCVCESDQMFAFVVVVVTRVCMTSQRRADQWETIMNMRSMRVRCVSLHVGRQATYDRRSSHSHRI